MAKAILSSVLAGLRGRIDGMVFRQQAGQTVVTPRPKVSGRASTPAQLAARERFSRAAAFLLRRPRQVQGFREHLANNLALPLLGG